MHGFVTGRSQQMIGIITVCALFLTVGTLWADDWAPLGMDSPNAAYHSTSAATYANSGGLEARVGELEAILAEMNAKEAEAKEKAEGKPSVQAGGRIMWDWAAFNQNTTSYAQIGDQLNGSEFRRARIFLKGTAFQVIDYKAQYDFADTNTADNKTLQSTAFKDVYIQVNELPILGHIRVGHFKEPVGLEQLTSARFITFMERSLADEYGFVPGRHSGIMAHDTYAHENGTWAIGCFGTDMTSEPPLIQTDDGGLALTMRGTYLPWYDEATEGRGLWHLGVSYSYRDTPDDEARFRQRPECHLADYIVDTGDIPEVPYWQLLGLETAFVYGPFSVQAEWLTSYVHRSVDDDLMYNGGYCYVSYFLTGENRTYKRDGGCFDRIKPFENFFRVRGEDGNVYTGKGAWELAYRWSYIDLSDYDNGDNHPGIVHDHTFGVNWYLNPYTRVMFNYVNSTLDNAIGVGNMSIFEMRAQIDF